MIAAIYARKSSDDNGVAYNGTSVARQIARARAYAVRKNWIVADNHIYVDDGVSGGQSRKRPALSQLMNRRKKPSQPKTRRRQSTR